MPDRLVIKKGKFKDIPPLKEIELAGNQLFPPGRLPDPLDTLPESFFRARASFGLLLVAKLGEQIVGFAVCDEQDQDLFLEEISVHPDFGRRGIGRTLLNHVIQLAQEKIKSRVTLTTFSDIRWNAPFYESFGFRQFEEDEIPEYIALHLRSEASDGMMNRISMVYEIPNA